MLDDADRNSSKNFQKAVLLRHRFLNSLLNDAGRPVCFGNDLGRGNFNMSMCCGSGKPLIGSDKFFCGHSYSEVIV